LTVLNGAGPAVQARLERLDLKTVEDLLFCLPTRYEDRRVVRRIAELREGRQEVFQGEVLVAGEAVTPRSRRRIFEVIVSDGSAQITLKWFHYRTPWMKQRFAVGRKAFFIAEVKRFGTLREAHHPDVEFINSNSSLSTISSSGLSGIGQILPVYPLTEGLHQKTARKIWQDAAARFAPLVQTHIPESLLKKRNLGRLDDALQQLHTPSADADIDRLNSGNDNARQTLVYDEFFFLELGLALKRRGVIIEAGIPFKVDHLYTRPLVTMLPYQLTAAQKRVLGEIKNDLMSPHPMNRLVQGDVGSGKTIVALMAALVAIENGCQVAVVAPTEILAEQHFTQFHTWLSALGLSTVLLSGSQSTSNKRDTAEKIAAGEVNLVVGTHAVLQEGITFKRLGLGIVDEQHRFGVRQRAVLRQKGENPHLLVMTATPIPRSLALTLYGDLALSVIDELPPGRTPVQTRVYPESRRTTAYQSIEAEIAAGRQAYIVYPLVEDSENSDLKAATSAAEYLQQDVFPTARIGLLHGRMKSEDKEAVMRAFKDHQLDILVATTVIEVGIDVPNATTMLIEHAERFGLAQLHQLRGRVGRGAAASHCFLIRTEKISEEGRQRLEIMARTSDGFQLAEADLELRGPGDFLGTRQAGLPDLRIANLLRDGRLLEAAREDAFKLAESPGFLTATEFTSIRVELKRRWGNRLELANIG
jgi:ATP-dependent DNA helicase RecG